MDTLIFLTTQTSATDSILRVICKISGEDFLQAKYIDKYLQNKPMKEFLNEELPYNGGLHRFNLPPFFPVSKIKKNHRFIINYRDPRDYLCNVYQWEFVHPNPSLTAEQLEERRRKVKSLGIDQFVLERADTNYFKPLLDALDVIDPNKLLVNTYAKLCLNFDGFIASLSKFLDVELTDSILSELENERVTKLNTNPNWIGNKWAGSDIIPGRYKNELKPQTIKILNDKFKNQLNQMAKYDPDYADLYLEGL